MRTGDDWAPRPISQRSEELVGLFRKRFGRTPEGIARAPGRVNLIGEHLDYNGGRVLPVAIDRNVMVAFASRDDATMHVHSVDFEQNSTFWVGSQIPHDPRAQWSHYVRGVCATLSETGYCGPGLDLAISGDILLGAGLSSSAALEVAVAGAVREAWQIDLDEKRLALLCQRAENDFVGVQCGAMDQLVAALGLAGHALLIDCKSLEWEHVPLELRERDVALVVVDSGQRRRLEQSDYNQRRDECAEALRLLRSSLDTRPETLCDVGLSDLKQASLPQSLLRRARHVITEQGRVDRAVEALRGNEMNELGTLMNGSHASLRDDFEVSTPELDRLVELAQVHAGTLGSRLTGAGFGGCTVNLVHKDSVDAFAAEVVERYVNETGLSVRMLVCRPSNGLRVERVG